MSRSMNLNFLHLTPEARRAPSEEVALVLTAAGDIYAIARSGASLAMTLSDGEVQTRAQHTHYVDGTHAGMRFASMCTSARCLKLNVFHVGPPREG